MRGDIITTLKAYLLSACKAVYLHSTLSLIYDAIAISAITAIVLYLLTHIISKLRRPAPLNLTPDSVVVIFGACMGIGKVMTLELAAKHRCRFIVIDRKRELFEELAKQIQQNRGSCECLNYDLSDTADVEKLADYLKKNYPKIDFLLYNAGVFFPNQAWEVSDYELRFLMNVNFFSPVKLIKELLPNVQASQGKHIAVVASVASFFYGSNISSYCASKHAIYGYFNSLRLDLKKSGRPVTLSIACPYAINTTLFRGFKARTELVLPMLDEKYVGKRLAKQFVEKKQQCNIQRRHTLILRILLFLPTFMADIANIMIDSSNFQERKVKGRDGSQEKKLKEKDESEESKSRKDD